MMEGSSLMKKLSDLEAQLQHSQEKLIMRENVISQLEEEIKGKERLIFEQNHLISILENDTTTSSHLQAIDCDNNNKYDTESMASESEITVIEREIVASSSSTSPCSSENSVGCRMADCRQAYRSECISHCNCKNKYEQALVDRERLELQNEQLLKQWEEALEYVSSVQRQLQEEISRNSAIKKELSGREKDDSLVIPRNVVNLISFIILVFGYFLYRL
ncbi:unnamed protein product [Caenorhabditis bovis]|uniref:Uncharacterized protein n=1 Tax=Caenorhabditis bovis TaxID=2654633 RepID=A0A8S1F9P2_9PELO|nr:unnamed protein product [Caenorhabditis bovis]